MYSTIQQKLKICIECGKPKRIFSHSRCQDCAKRHYPGLKRSMVPLKRSPIKRKVKLVIQNGKDLTQKEAFLIAYNTCGGKWFLTGEKVAIEELIATNFGHVLPKAKNKYPWFKYYPKNIVLLTEDQHDIYDKGNSNQMIDRTFDFPEENWEKLAELRLKLLKEYNEWIKTNPGVYKL